MAFVDESGLQQVWNNIADINSWMPRNAAAHNSIYRGKDITSKYEDGSLVESIVSGTFDDVFVGDWFGVTFGNVWDSTFKELSGNQLVDPSPGLSAQVERVYHYRIMELNRYSGSNNAVIMSDCVGGTSPIHTSNTLPATFGNSALAASAVWSDVEDFFIPENLKSHLVEYGETFYNGSGTPGISPHQKSCLLSEEEVFGHSIQSANQFDVATTPTQLAAFRYNPDLIWGDRDWWLRSMTSIGYAFISNTHVVGSSTPTAAHGLRIKFVVGGNPS